MLVTREVAARLEAAEAGSWLARLRALATQQDSDAGVEVAPFGRTVCTWVGSRADNPSCNRVFGFSDDDVGLLAQIVGWFAQRGARMWFDLAPPLVSGGALTCLAAAGLRPERFFSVLCLDPAAAGRAAERAAADAAIDIRRVCPQREAHAIAVPFCAGYGIPPQARAATERNLPLEYSEPGWRVFVASIGDQPAAVACLHLQGAAGCVAAMATAPEHRRQGCQGALLDRCVAESAAAGCRLLSYQTEPASAAERNVLRAGFRIAYTKVVLSPAGAPTRPSGAPCGGG